MVTGLQHPPSLLTLYSDCVSLSVSLCLDHSNAITPEDYVVGWGNSEELLFVDNITVIETEEFLPPLNLSSDLQS